MSVGVQSLKSPTSCAFVAPVSAGMQKVTDVVPGVRDGSLCSGIVDPFVAVIAAHETYVSIDAADFQHPAHRRLRLQDRHVTSFDDRTGQPTDAARVDEGHLVQVDHEPTIGFDGVLDGGAQRLTGGEVDLAR